MHTEIPSFSSLFAQLGLPHEDADIRDFIAAHAPLPGEVRLEDAPFWTPAQARLLKDSLTQDAAWAEVADQLSLALRAAVPT